MEKTYEISKPNLLSLHRKGNNDTKNDLELLYGPEIFKVSSDIRDHIKSFADAWAMHPATPEQQRVLDSGYAPSIAGLNLQTFVKALNTNPITGEIWKADHTNGQRNWRIVWINKPGVGFVFYFTACDGGCATVGSRLEFEKEELAIYAGNHKEFVEAWNIYSPTKL